MAEYELFAHLRIPFIGLILLLLNANDACATQCSDKFSGASPVVSMCFGGRATGRVIVLDAQTASKNDTECDCFLTAKGSIVLTVNAAQEPGYAGCGSKIDVSFSSPRELYTFNCFANSYNQMDNGSTANLTLLKSTSASQWNYCLVLQVYSSDQSDTIEMVCSGPAIGQTTLSTLETTVATVETMLTSSSLLSTTKTKEQLSTDSISSTVSENLTTEGMSETTLTNFTTRSLSTTVPTTRLLIVPSTTSNANMISPTSPHVDPFPSTEKETSPPPGLSTTPNNVWTTTQETIVTINVTTSTNLLSSNQTQTSARTTVSTVTMDSANSSANMINPTSPYINPFPSTEKEKSPPPVVSTTPTTVLTTTKETILTEEAMTTTTAISPNQTQENIQLTSPLISTPNGAASETTTIASNTTQVRFTSLKTEPTTDISLSRSTISPVSESSSVTTSVIATPTRTSTSLSSNITSSTMETTHTSVTTKTTTHTIITSLKPTVRTTEPTLPSTNFSTTPISTTVILAQKTTSTKPAISITQPVTQNASSSSSSSTSASSSASSSSSSLSSSSFTSTSASLPSSSFSSSSEAAATPAATNTSTSPYTTSLSTRLPNATMYTSSSLPQSPSSSSSSSQSTTRRASTTAFESRANISEGITGGNITTSTLEKKDFELLPVVLPAALTGAIIIALFLFLTFTVVIRYRRTKSYHTGHNGEFHKAIYSETTRNKDGPSWPTGYDNLICSKNNEVQSPLNGVELVPIKNIYGEKPVNITDHPQTSVSDDHL